MAHSRTRGPGDQGGAQQGHRHHRGWAGSSTGARASPQREALCTVSVRAQQNEIKSLTQSKKLADITSEHNDPKIRANAHSDSYWTPIDTFGFDMDVMLECKHKELGLFKMRELMTENLQLAAK